MPARGADAAYVASRTGPGPDLIDLILSRRSVAPKRLVAPGPTVRELELIVSAAATTPDHCGLRPWRLIHFPDEARPDLAELFAAAKREQEPQADDLEVERARRRAFNAPTLLGAIFSPVADHPRVPESEQLVTLGAGLQNILLASHALGYAAMITSGSKMRTRVFQEAFCRTSRERPVAFVSIGTATVKPRPHRLADIHSYLSAWPDTGPTSLD